MDGLGCVGFPVSFSLSGCGRTFRADSGSGVPLPSDCSSSPTLEIFGDRGAPSLFPILVLLSLNSMGSDPPEQTTEKPQKTRFGVPEGSPQGRGASLG